MGQAHVLRGIQAGNVRKKVPMAHYGHLQFRVVEKIRHRGQLHFGGAGDFTGTNYIDGLIAVKHQRRNHNIGNRK